MTGEKVCARCRNPLGDAWDSNDHACPTPVPSEVAETTAGEREVEALATWLHDEVGGCCVSRFPECVFGGDAIRDEARRLLTTGYLAALLDRVRREEGAKVLREAAEYCEATIAGALGSPRNDFADGWRDASWLFLAELRDRAASVGRGEGQ